MFQVRVRHGVPSRWFELDGSRVEFAPGSVRTITDDQHGQLVPQIKAPADYVIREKRGPRRVSVDVDVSLVPPALSVEVTVEPVERPPVFHPGDDEADAPKPKRKRGQAEE